MNDILFVDDDMNILSGLRRRARGQHPEWNISFATSGAEALSLCDQKTFDVVVSDMRMPGMDGAELLHQLQENSPDTARIILSGYSEDEAILRTVGPAQRYLAKPCDDEVLFEAIAQMFKMRTLLLKPDIRSIIGGIDALASPPDTYTRLVNALEDPKAGNDKVTAIVSSDIALTAEILKVTNSAYFALPSKITSISHAVRMIGTDTLKSLAIFVGLFKSFDGPPVVTRRIKTLCERSQQIGVAAALIGEHEKLSKATCQLLPSIGMMSHIGSLILYLYYHERMETVIARVEQEDISIVEAERDEFGAAHPEIGAYLLGLWGFPEQVIQAVACHHNPADFAQTEMTELTALYAAQHITREMGGRASAQESEEQSTIDMSYLEQIGKADSVEAWRKIVATVLESYT